MGNYRASEIYDQLHEKINVYLQEDSYQLLVEDAKNFEIIKKKNKEPNLSELINNLIKNYIQDYFDTIERSSNAFLKVLEDSIPFGTKVDLQRLSRDLAFSKVAVTEQKGKHSKTLSFRINTSVFPTVASALSDVPETMDLSAFFRSMIISYQALPLYKRESIIYLEEIKIINDAIKHHEKVSYYNKHNGKKVTFIPFSIEHSKQELYNYVTGQFDNSHHNSGVIRLARMGEIYPVHEKGELTDSFSQHLEIMKANGIQFPISQNILHKVIMDENTKRIYERRYIDRPRILKEYIDSKQRTIAVFDCGDTQLKSYFYPFSNRNELIIPSFFEAKNLQEQINQYLDSNKAIHFQFENNNYSLTKEETIILTKSNKVIIQSDNLDVLLNTSIDNYSLEEVFLSLTSDDIQIN